MDPERIAQLPPALVITKLMRSYPSHQRNTSVLAISAFIAKLPAVKDVEFDWWEALRFTRIRNDIADALPQVKYPIDKFTLRETIYRNAGEYPLTSETLWEEEDKLLKSIHTFSQRVEEVKIDHIAINEKFSILRCSLPV
ncbi:hypothetical protein GGI43DRAFT_277542 [Trichoderma evansii]